MNLKAYKDFMALITDINMSLRMWVKIFKINVFLWLIVLVVLLLLLATTGLTQTGFVKILPFTLTVFGLYPLLIWFFYRYSKNKNYTLRGPQIVKEEELAALLETELTSSIEAPWRISPTLAIPASWCLQHALIVGCSGSGKTNIYNQRIDQLQDSKVVILDAKSGELTSRFYCPERDRLLNIFDNRSVRWNLFSEIFSIADFDTIASSCIPEPPDSKDPFWTNSARHILSDSIAYLYQTKKRSMQELYRFLCLPISELRLALEQFGSPAARYIQNEGNQAQGVMSTLHAATNRIFRFLAADESETTFAISDWLNDGKPGKLFLNHDAKNAASSKEILSLFCSVLINLLLSRPDTQDPRQRVDVLLVVVDPRIKYE